MSARGPARNPIRAPAMPKQCDTENVATACSETVTAGISSLAGSIASGPCVTSSISRIPWRSARRASAATSSARAAVPYGLTGSTRQIALVRGVIAAATAVGVEPVAGAGPERDRHRPAARGDDRGRKMEVAGVADDDLVARVHGGHQREREAGLRALGPDDLERRVAVAAEHGGARVAQRLDQVGRVHVERVGHHRVAHRLDRRRGRPAEARQPAEVGPVGRQPRRALGIQVVGLEADERDRVAVRDVVPHRVVAALQRAQALGHGERAGRGRVGRPGEDVRHVPASARTRRTTR